MEESGIPAFAGRTEMGVDASIENVKQTDSTHMIRALRDANYDLD